MSEAKAKSIRGQEYNIFVDCLRAARRTARLTQEQMAERLGTDQSYISKYERGERRLDIVELRAICVVLDIKLVDFVRTLEEQLKAKGRS